MNGSASSSNPRRPAAPSAAAQLAPGFRFHPTDEELVSYYLKRKVAGKSLRIDAIAEIDLYKCEPWDLPPLSRIVSRDLEWYFFSPLDRKYSNRSRMNRSTAQGYWKTTGKDRPIRHNNRVVGMKKTLVYHAGRAPRGERTNWVMHEYRLEDQELAGTVTCTGIPQDAYVVCRIFKKSGPGPQNGAQYGAPYNEEEWEETDGGMIVLRDDADDDFFDAGEQEQEYLQMNDFLQNQYPDHQHANDSDFVAGPNFQDNGNHQEDPSVSLEEILNDPSFNNDMVERTDEPGLLDGPVLGIDIGKKIGMADLSFSPSQNDGYVELNDLANTVNAADPPSEDSVGCSLRICNDWQPVDGADDSINLQEILDVEEFFDAVNENINQPELFQMSPTLCDNYNLQPIDLRNPLAGDCPSSQLAEGDTMFYDAPINDLAFTQDDFAELNHLLDSPISDPSGFDMVDNLMAYFDATDDNLHANTADSLEKSVCVNSSILDQFNLTPEFGINAQPNKVSPWASEANVASGPSSSLRSPDVGNQLKTENHPSVEPDVQRSENNGKTITKCLANMLGSISAPPAIAAEYPVRRSGKPVGQISEAHSASSIHVTAGMIQIRGLAVTGSTERWSLQKNGDAGFLLSYSMAGNEVKKSVVFEPISKMQSGSVSVVLRGGFYLFFLSALILTLSYRVGLCIYSR